MLNQHAVISDLQQTEEILVEQHKAMNDFLQQFLPESQRLQNETNYVEYDQDSKFKLEYTLCGRREQQTLHFYIDHALCFFADYCKRGEELFTQLAELATDCRDMMAQFRTKLVNEEMLSHNVSTRPNGNGAGGAARR